MKDQQTEPTPASAGATRRGPWLGRLLGTDRGNLLERLLPWAHKGGLTIFEYGLVYGSHFLVSVLLARWLSAEQYGAFAVAWSVFVLLSLIYQSLILEPMSVFGGSTYRSNFRAYFASLMWIHIVLSLAIFLLFGASAGVSRMFGAAAGMPAALAGVTIASPCVFYFWLARRSCYLELVPGQALAGAFVYSGVILVALWVFYRQHLLSPFIAFILVGIGSLATGTFLMVRRRLLSRSGGPRPPTRELARQHWNYGAWALAACVASWIPAYIYFPIVSSFGSMAQSGQLKALMNLTVPLEQTKSALTMLLLPYAAGVQHSKDGSAGKVLTMRLTLFGAGMGLVYWALIIPFSKPLFHMLYSGGYMDVAYEIPIVAVGSIFWSAAYGPAMALRAMKSPTSVFKAFLIAAVASLVIGVPATWMFGLSGAIWGMNVADIASFAAVCFLLYGKLKAHTPVLASEPNVTATVIQES